MRKPIPHEEGCDCGKHRIRDPKIEKFLSRKRIKGKLSCLWPRWGELTLEESFTVAKLWHRTLGLDDNLPETLSYMLLTIPNAEYCPLCLLGGYKVFPADGARVCTDHRLPDHILQALFFEHCVAIKPNHFEDWVKTPRSSMCTSTGHWPKEMDKLRTEMEVLPVRQSWFFEAGVPAHEWFWLLGGNTLPYGLIAHRACWSGLDAPGTTAACVIPEHIGVFEV